jgi:dipeptidyl aminopeptidase/acylaminoacyl peptidase
MFSVFNIFAQKKIPLNASVYDAWQTLKNQQISHNGQWVSYEAVPYRGDINLYFIKTNKTAQKIFHRASNSVFSADDSYAVFRVKASFDSIRKLKIKKVKKDLFPKDSLYVFMLKTKQIYKFPRLFSFKTAKEKSEWLAFCQYEKESEQKNTTRIKKYDKYGVKIYALNLFNPLKNKILRFKNISEYAISRNGKYIIFVRARNDSIEESKIFVFNTESEKIDSLPTYKGIIKRITPANYTNTFAYIASSDTIKNKVYSLYICNNFVSRKIVDTTTKELPRHWTVSPNGKMFFARNDSKLFFGTAPVPKRKQADTIPDDEKIRVDIWSWTDSILQPMQKIRLKEDMKKTYLTVYRTDNRKIFLIQNKFITKIKVPEKYNSDIALGESSTPYLLQRSWDFPYFYDYYIINLKNGQKRKVLTKNYHTEISPFGKYLIWYSYSDSCWYDYNIFSGKKINLTKKIGVGFYNDENDVPAPASSYSYAGFTKNDKYVLIYDKYDIWKIDSQTGKAINLTHSFGRKNKITFRYQQTDLDKDYIDSKMPFIAKGFNNINKQSGFYRVDLQNSGDPKKLLVSNHDYLIPTKAKNAMVLIWRRMNVKDFPDLWTSSYNFSNPIKLSSLNPQQKKYIWAKVELIKWRLPDGKSEEGLLYKPDNFDSTKKYPMIVYFYELYSNRLNYHYIPAPSRSIINPTFYASNGYIVFIPNIRYKIGYPGQSAVEYVVSGTKSLIKKHKWIDKEHIGIQGQSWGGYESAYIITQTNMFACAEAGAPVSNMTSAYGGIRWASGMSREFQYEKTQSRIGANLWQKRNLYIENSPVFFADKVHTPLLIMHNDHDGAVPWYQGIEYFMALRRLRKPVWLLSYNNQPHNLQANSPDRKDLDKRMFEFFNHYLKNKGIPAWMKYGITQLEKGKKLKYELIKD